MEYVLHKIYVNKSINHSVKSLFSKKLLVNLTKECAFSVNSSLIKQIDGCPMIGPVVVPAKPIFYKSYVNDTYITRKKVLMMNYSGI